MIAFRTDWIDQLYVLPEAQGRGVGTEFAAISRNCFRAPAALDLSANARARRFYEARGFALVEETDGARNEEKESTRGISDTPSVP